MNTLTILQNALIRRANGKSRCTQAKAIRIANNRLGGEWAVAQDTKRLCEKESLIRDLHGEYHETPHLLMPVRISVSRTAINEWISKSKYNRGLIPEVYKCYITGELCHEDYIPKLAVINDNGIYIYVAGSYCERLGHIFRWYDGIYRTSREPNTGVMRDYHASIRPPWWATAQGIGMELEINSSDRDKLASQLDSNILAERDGSLDGYKGVELIGGPYSYEEYQTGKTPWNDTLEKIKKIGGSGYNATGGSGFYGIHLSLSSSLFNPFHGAKFVVFFNQQKELCQLIGQRSNLYRGNDSGGYGIRKKVTEVVFYDGAISDKSTMHSHINGSVDRKITRKNTVYYNDTGKYEPVKVDNKRYEVRIFRSNLNWERILKNIEFVDAVRVYTKDASALSVATPYTGTADFLYWLGKQAGYNHLKKFLVDNAKNFTDNENSNKFTQLVNFKINKPLPTEDPAVSSDL